MEGDCVGGISNKVRGDDVMVGGEEVTVGLRGLGTGLCIFTSVRKMMAECLSGTLSSCSLQPSLPFPLCPPLPSTLPPRPL